MLAGAAWTNRLQGFLYLTTTGTAQIGSKLATSVPGEIAFEPSLAITSWGVLILGNREGAEDDQGIHARMV